MHATTPDNLSLDINTLLRDSAVLVALFDPQDRLRHANAAFLSTYHTSLAAAPTWSELLRDNYVHKRGVALITTDFDTWLASARARRASQPFRAFETDMCDGRWLWMTETLQADGSMLCIATDITSLKASEHAMRHARDTAVTAANTDVLTGIGNRRYVLGRLDHLLTNLRAPTDQLSVVVADLDHFKRINDSLGHPAGDEIIRDFAQRSQRLLSDTDTVGRVGGEEFMLLLPSLCTDKAEQLVAHLHTEVRQARPVSSRPECSYTFSAGITDARAGESLEAVFRRADRALYLAKNAGRNQTARVD